MMPCTSEIVTVGKVDSNGAMRNRDSELERDQIAIEVQAAVPIAEETQHVTVQSFVYREPLTGDDAIYNLSENELMLFSYCWTVKILAILDICFTLT